ncbi:hypothetical protein [Photobacterium nomapromontoriensis]|uniref:hypothetical protein n=1 Tax=Photobacterium nomapromontoriensis TaxID=2910237 RepID=UPI003D1526A6
MSVGALKLPTFSNNLLSIGKSKNVISVFQGNWVTKIKHYVLGPSGSNISQAAQGWSKLHSLCNKHELIYCITPEDAITRSEQEYKRGEINLAWTCAVYFKEHELFFSNHDHALFFDHYRMQLDQMQLACRKNKDLDFLSKITVASHPSPSVLLKHDSAQFSITDATSNSDAARLCADGKVDTCITTESAKKLYDLNTLHEFGSPEMVFFASLPPSSSEYLQELLYELQ